MFVYFSVNIGCYQNINFKNRKVSSFAVCKFSLLHIFNSGN